MTVLLDCRAPMVVRSHTPLGMKEQVVDSLRGLEGPARHQRIKALATALLPATLSAHASATLDEDEPAGLAAHGGPRSVALGMLSPA